MSRLDGQTLREFVDEIVGLDLKMSPILVVDVRWQKPLGSFRLNSDLFPKAKVLFEILRNKGFKIVLTVDPYVELVSEQKFDNSVSSTHPSRGHKLHARLPIGRAKISGKIVTRRLDFFKFKNVTISQGYEEADTNALSLTCNDSAGLTAFECALIDMGKSEARHWFAGALEASAWLSKEADALLLAGTQPHNWAWDAGLASNRGGYAQLIDDLFYKKQFYTIPQYTGNFGFIQISPRRRDWQGLKSTLEAVLNLGALGFAIVHPGSVWGDLNESEEFFSDVQNYTTDRELLLRWLQLFTFMPVLQFKDLKPFKRDEMDSMRLLMQLRKTHVIPEIKRHLPFSPLFGNVNHRKERAMAIVNGTAQGGSQLPLIRHVWYTNAELGKETIVEQQFFLGTDIMVAPILAEGQRQRDIYLPNGLWTDQALGGELRGGKWLKNYPLEVEKIAWFTRVKR